MYLLSVQEVGQKEIAMSLQEGRAVPTETASSNAALVKDGIEYRLGDFVFVKPGVFDELQHAGTSAAQIAEYAAKGRFYKGGTNTGLRPYGVAQLVSFGKNKDSKKAERVSPVQLIIAFPT